MRKHTGLLVARPGLVREGLQAVLAATGGLDVLEPANDGALAIEKLQIQQPSLVILDASLTQNEMSQTLAQIKQEWPDVRCIAVAANFQQERVLEALGADAVLLQGFSAVSLSTTIKTLLAQSATSITSDQE
jgi:DNA-binding NarL/FixJ family response regulator